MSGRVECVGLLGWLFGHKFTSFDGVFDYKHCRRCGMPEGGWAA